MTPSIRRSMRAAFCLTCLILVLGAGWWGVLRTPGHPVSDLGQSPADAPEVRNPAPGPNPGEPEEIHDAAAKPSARPTMPVTAATARRPWERDFFAIRSEAVAGSPIRFALTGGLTAVGTVGHVEHANGELIFVSGELNAPEQGRFFFRKQLVPGKQGDFAGVVEFFESKRAWRIEPSGPDGAAELVERQMDEVICLLPPPSAEVLAAEAQEIPPLDPSDVPDYVPSYNDGLISLESLPGAPGVLYIDFRGGYTSAWGGITYDKPGVSNAQIKDVWKRVAEDFMAFNINVTTDIKVYEAAQQGRRQRCICTPTTTAAPGAGGVSYLDSWNWGGDTPNWSFYSTGKSAAEVISHECGHALNLSHDGRTSPSEGYYGGHGSGSTGWAPIMGVGYNKPVTQWSKGEYSNANNLQDDLTIITNNNGVDYRADDTGDALATARYLEVYADQSVFAEGVIETSGDIDAFRFSTNGGNVTLRADPAPGEWANLAIKAELLNSAGNVIASDNDGSRLWASVGANLAAGTYTLQVVSVGRGAPPASGFSNYGSLGYYSVSGTVANPVPMTYLNIAENSANGSTVGTIAANNPNSDPLVYSIVSGNTGNVFALGNNGVLTVANGVPLNYETLALSTQLTVQYELFVNITNPSNPTLNETNRRVVVKILDVNEAPSATGFSASVYANSQPGTVVGTVAATDPDFHTSVAFSILSGNPNNAFSIDPASGVVTVTGSLPSSLAGNYVLGVQVTDGSLTATVNANLTVLPGYSGVWTNTAGGSWATASNWSGGVVAGGVGETADFSTLNLTTNRTLTLNGNRVIGTLLFGDTTPNANWTITPGSGGTLTLNSGGAPVITVNNQTATIATVLAGTRGLVKNGAGSLILTAANTYTGATAIESGKLVFKAPSDADWTLPSGVTIASGATGTIDFTAQTSQYRKTSLGTHLINTGGVLELTGPTNNLNDWYLINSWNVSGGGTIRVLNGGISCWTGAANALAGFTGLIDIQGGQFSSNVSGSTTLGGSFDVNVSSGGKLDLRSGNFTMDALTGSGAVIKSWTGDTATFTIGSNNGSGAWTGSMAGSNYNLVKSGTGTQTLAGSGIAYPGMTTVNQGVLLLSNATAFASAVTVNATGTFGGTGSCSAAVTVNTGGTLVPGGAGIGTLSVNNTLTLAGTVNAEINKTAGTADQVQGVATLTYGGVLNVTNLSGILAANDTFTLFGATNYTGNFSGVNLPAPGAGLTWDLSNLSVDGSIQVVDFTGIDPPASPPTGLAATAVSASQINLTWNAVTGATTYGVSRDGTPVATVSGTSFSDSGLTMGTTYSYTVTAINPGGSSAASNSVSATTSLAGVTLAWDANTGSAGAQDGNGVWSNSSANWWYSPNNQSWADGNAASFGVNTASNPTVTLANNVTPTAITFNTTAGGTYTISGSGGIILSGSVPITTHANGTLNVTLKGNGALLKSGAGTLFLGSTNTFIGSTTLSQGSIRMATNTALGSGAITLGDANTGTSNIAWLFQGGGTPSNSITVTNQGSGTVTLGTHSSGNYTNPTCPLTLNRPVTLQDGTGDRTSFVGKISGPVGTLTLAGTRVTFDNAANDFTGEVIVQPNTVYQNNVAGAVPDACVFTLQGSNSRFRLNSNSETIGSLNGPGIVDNVTGSGNTLSLGGGNASGSFTGTLVNGSGTFHLTKTGSGMQTLGGTNTYTGSTTVNGGSLVVNGSLASASTVMVNSGGTLAGRGTVNGPVTLGYGATLSAGDPTIGTLTLGNTLALHDSATVTLRVHKTGATRTADKISLTGSSGITYKGTLAITIAPGSDALAIGDKFTLFSKTSGNFAGAFASFDLPTPGAGLKWETANLTVDGSIEIVASVETPVFSPEGGGYVGPITVNISSATPGADIRYTTDGTDPKTSSTAVTSPSPAAVNIDAPDTVTLKTYAYKPGLDDSNVATAGYLTYPANSAVWSNPAGGSWPVGANWLNGGIAGGSDVIARFDTLPLSGNPVVTLDGPAVAGGLSFADTGNQYSWTLNSGSAGPLTLSVSSGSPLISVANQSVTLGAVIAGNQGLVKSGPGTLVLGATNTYTGTTVISQGRLALNSNSALPSTANIVIGDANSGNTAPNLYLGNQLNPTLATLTVAPGVANAALHTSGWAPAISGLTTLNSPLTLKQYDGGFVHTGLQTNGRITGPGAGAGNDTLIFQYGGTQNFYWEADNTAPNDFAGNIRITGAPGNMNAQGGSNAPNNVIIPDAAMVTIDPGCTFRWNNFGNNPVVETFDGLAGAGNMGRNTGGGLISSLNLTIQANNASNEGKRTFTGSLSNVDSLTFGGTGTQVLGGANSYTGPTTVNDGTLLINGSLATTATTVNAAGTLGGTGVMAGTVNSNGTLAPGSNAIGNLTINNTLTLAGSSKLAWQIADWTGAPGAGFDKITATTLDLTATSANPITLELTDLSLANFSETNTSFILVQTSSGITGFSVDKFTVDSNGLPQPQGTWAVQQTGNNLVLAYTAYTAQPNPDANANGILDTWETVHFGNADTGVNLPGDDADHDGITNLMEYALGTDPLAHSAGPVVDIEPLDDTRYLRITVNKNPQATNLSYIVETCGAFNDWSSANTVIEPSPATQLIVRDSISSAAAPRRFIRLRVVTLP